MPRGKHILGQKAAPHIFGTVRVGQRGQIVIPKEARDLYHIRPGDTLLILSSGKGGLIVSRPDVVHDLANRILEEIEETTDGDE